MKSTKANRMRLFLSVCFGIAMCFSSIAFLYAEDDIPSYDDNYGESEFQPSQELPTQTNNYAPELNNNTGINSIIQPLEQPSFQTGATIQFVQDTQVIQPDETAGTAGRDLPYGNEANVDNMIFMPKKEFLSNDQLNQILNNESTPLDTQLVGKADVDVPSGNEAIVKNMIDNVPAGAGSFITKDSSFDLSNTGVDSIIKPLVDAQTSGVTTGQAAAESSEIADHMPIAVYAYDGRPLGLIDPSDPELRGAFNENPKDFVAIPPVGGFRHVDAYNKFSSKETPDYIDAGNFKEAWQEATRGYKQMVPSTYNAAIETGQLAPVLDK